MLTAGPSSRGDLSNRVMTSEWAGRAPQRKCEPSFNPLHLSPRVLEASSYASSPNPLS